MVDRRGIVPDMETEAPEVPREIPANGNGAAAPDVPSVGYCEGCKRPVRVTDAATNRDGERSHPVPAGKRGVTMRWCGPVKIAYVYLLGYVVRVAGEPERTERTDAAMPGPLTDIRDIEQLEAKLVEREASKLIPSTPTMGELVAAAFDSGSQPVVRITSYQLMRSV